MVHAIHPKSIPFYNALMRYQPAKKQSRVLKEHHEDSHEHSDRVCMHSIDLGFRNGLDLSDIMLLGYGSRFHDLGKCYVPLVILAKHGPLDAGERLVMNGHPRLGFIQFPETEYGKIRKLIVTHHEHTTNPYPRTGKERRVVELAPRNAQERRDDDPRIKVLSQIIAAADIHDALISPRVYKPSLPKDQVESIMRTQFTGDQRFVDQLLEYN